MGVNFNQSYDDIVKEYYKLTLIIGSGNLGNQPTLDLTFNRAIL